MTNTPGPWTADSRVRTAINAGPKHIAMVNFYNSPSGSTNVSGDEHYANARLIAAAPDLLTALRVAHDHLEHMAAWIGKQNAGYSFESLGEDMPSISSALAKARLPTTPTE